jgi:serine/threonine protein kinase
VPKVDADGYFQINLVNPKPHQLPCLVMEKINGYTLEEVLINSPQGCSEDLVIGWFIQAVQILQELHQRQIIHRDIKPSNILMSSDGNPKLTDFGLARDNTSDSIKTKTGVVFGTPDYMSPEQRKDANLTDKRSDLWSLGATLYQMVTGKSPKVIRLDQLPAGLAKVIGKVLEENKDDRYQTALEFRDALKDCLEDPLEIKDSGPGKCQNCRTKNESGRQFCRNCAASLSANCMNCGKTIPVWDEVCDGCATKQSPLLSKRRSEFTIQQKKAEELLKIHDFDSAIFIARQCSKELNPRLAYINRWSETLLNRVDQEKQKAAEKVSEILSQVEIYKASNDYESALKLMDTIPDSLRKTQFNNNQESVFAIHEELIHKHKELMDSKTEMDYWKSEAERCLANSEFENSMRYANLLCNETHPQLQHLKEWSKDFLKKIADQQNALVEQIALIIKTAESLEANNSYEEGLNELMKIHSNHHSLRIPGYGFTVGSMVERIHHKIYLRETRREKILVSQAEANRLLNSFEYDKALKAAVALWEDDSPRNVALEDWMNTFVAQVQADRVDQQIRIGHKMAQAEMYEKSFDYLSALRVLEDIPLVLRAVEYRGHSEPVSKAQERLNSKIFSMKHLDRAIRERMNHQDFDGLIHEVENLLVLQPNRTDMIRLYAQLQEQENNSYSQHHQALLKAWNLLEQQEYDSCIQNLHLIEASEFNTEVIKLKDEAQVKLDQYHALMDVIREDLKQKRFSGLLKKLEECIVLKLKDTRLHDLRDKLIDREASILEIYESAFALHRNSQFDSALEMLLKIPKGFQSDSVKELQNKCVLALKSSHSRSNESEFFGTSVQPVNYSYTSGSHQMISGLNAGDVKSLLFYNERIDFRWCPPGRFKMGSPETEPGRRSDENQINVEISNGFWMMETPVTQWLWKAVTGNEHRWTPLFGIDPDYPTYHHSHDDASAFAIKLTKKLQAC